MSGVEFTNNLLDNGPLAKKFLSFEKRPGIVNLFNPQNDIERGDIAELLQRFNCITRTLSHTHYINVDDFEKYCYDTLEFMKKKFKWMPIPKSLHKSFAHAAKKIRENGGQSLGHLSESPLEGTVYISGQ